MAELDRSWIAFGPECGAEDAAYEVCLHTEAEDEDETFTITMISDLEKGFEKVHHQNIAEAAETYGFPKATPQAPMSHEGFVCAPRRACASAGRGFWVCK